MKPLLAKIKPAHGFSYLVHLGLRLLLPLALFVLVRLPGEFVQLALSLVLLSKWRMFAVRPRFWPAMVRANAVDIMVGISVVLFMAHTTNYWWQLAWAVLYAFWLVAIKPASGLTMVSLQAMLGQLAGLMALFLTWSDAPAYGLVAVTGVICYFSARHFFDSFDEPYAKLLAYLWGYFGAALMWVLAHWLVFYYGVLPQPVVILSTLGYGLAALYYFDHSGKLSPLMQRQFIFIMVAILLVILTFSDWGDKIV